MATPSLEIKNASFKNEQKLFSLQNAYLNFTIFFLYWFAIGVDRVDGWKCIPEHQTDYCKRLQFKRKTSTQMPRFHLKSTVTEAFICWKLFRMERVWNEWDYMSFTQDLGEYHTKRLKRYIDAMPEVYQNHRSLSSAESIIYYELKDHSGPKKFLCEPSGILSFKRGRHPTGMICDDILKDPAVKLDLSQLIKIERAFVEEIENMPSEDLHLVGTPQDQEDLFHKKSKDPAFDSKIYTAEADPTNKKALWESNPKFNWVELMKKKKANPKMYMKEFMCMPVRSMDAYISLDQINDSIKSRLKNYSFARPAYLKGRTVVGGFDIGKKTHPSHFSIFALSRKQFKCVRINKATGETTETMEYRAYQIHSKFMDGWDYIDQIDYIKSAISVFHVDKLFYDNTRSEFESAAEAGSLPAEMEPVSFTVKEKFSMATELDIAMSHGLVWLINDDRQKRQMLSVDCDLKAAETEEGHGDAFFSNGLAIKARVEASAILIS